MNDNWTVVNRKNHKKNNKALHVKLDKNEVINKLKFLSKYNPHGVYLCGSTARNTHKINSDLDILIIWKKYVPNNIHEIKTEIESLFNKSVDLLSLIYKGKLILDIDNFKIYDKWMTDLDNVITDAVPIIGNIVDIKLSDFGLKI